MLGVAYADPLYTFHSTQEEQRFSALTKEIRCVVCQNQSIADSAAPLASDLRDKVYQMINTHKTDAEIESYLVKRYGEFILFKPPVHRETLLLWFFPLLAVVVAGWVLKYKVSHEVE
jgi:cytochrome c-type biogenesis protein CcmH